MESNLVRIQYPAKKIFSAPKSTEDFGTWEWGVKKNSNLGHGNTACKVRWKDEQVKAMDPHKVSLVEALNHHFRKLAIDSVVRCPKLCLASSASMDWTLSDIVHAVLGELR